jgi:hypothetical protein
MEEKIHFRKINKIKCSLYYKAHYICNMFNNYKEIICRKKNYHTKKAFKSFKK